MKTLAAFSSARVRHAPSALHRIMEWMGDRENPVRRLAQIALTERRLPKSVGSPLKGVLGLGWRTNLHMVEIEITTLCNLHCYNCDRSCGKAASDEGMTREQVRRFVLESIELGWKWNWIKVLGGEPTLHPDLIPILRELGRYREAYKGCVVEIVTNGRTRSTNETLKKLPDWVRICNTRKTTRAQDFDACNSAPIDTPGFEVRRALKACAITEYYGMGLTRYGFYQCGAGASIDRVFGFGMGIRRMKDLKAGHLSEQRAVLCSLCGHLCPVRTNQERTSASWQRAYERYSVGMPRLPLY